MWTAWGVANISQITLFGLTTLICFGSVARARTRLDDSDTRWGLTSLLALCGFWSAFTVGRLVVSSPEIKLVFYLLGLVTGLATIGAWLYFCSAYTGKSYHHQPIYRWGAVGLYLGIVVLKITSPIHGLYFSASTPTPTVLHISPGVLHWIVTGLAYTLSAVGFYMLFEQFRTSTYITTRLTLLLGFAAFPAIMTIATYLYPSATTLSYEPVGVALFALGVLYVADGTFVAVHRFGREQLIDELDEAILILDDEGTIKDMNTAAQQLFPTLSTGLSTAAATTIPEISEYVSNDDPCVVTADKNNTKKYYLLSTQSLEVGQTTIGTALVLSDVTRLEQQRQKIESHRAQRDEFAEAISHELRNAVNITQGHLELIREQLDPETDIGAIKNLSTATSIINRVEHIVDNLAMVARYGHPVEESTTIEVAPAVREAWEMTVTEDQVLHVTADGTIDVDPTRFKHLLESLFEFLIKNGATEIEVTFADGEIVVTDDGKVIPETEVERAFAYGDAVPDAESGMLLPIVRTLADAHEWNVTIDTTYRDGICLCIDLMRQREAKQHSRT